MNELIKIRTNDNDEQLTVRSPIDLKSPILSDMPRGEKVGNVSEDTIIDGGTVSGSVFLISRN